MKLLVIKRDKLGDLLLTTPVFAHLRATRPDVEIHLLANDYNAWVVADDPHIDRRWIYRRVRTGNRVSVGAAIESALLGWRLRREHFDVALVANGAESPRAIARGVSIGARRVIACVAPGHRFARLTDPLPERDGMHETDRMLAMLAPLGIPMPTRTLYPQYRLPAAAGREAEAWLAARDLAPRGYVVIGLGARRAKKQPTRDQILRWAARFAEDHGLATVFMWTPGKSDNPLYPGDDEVAQPVLDARSPHVHPFRGPILPAIALVWNARTSIFPDSGLMHFAAASPGGVLGLFAETNVSPPPSQWGPRGPRAAWLEARRSVSELTDDTVFATLAPNLADPVDLAEATGPLQPAPEPPLPP